MMIKRYLYVRPVLEIRLQKRTLHTSAHFLRLSAVGTGPKGCAPLHAPKHNWMQDGKVALTENEHSAVDCVDWLLTSWQQVSAHASSSSLFTSSPAYKRCLDEAEKCCSVENKEGASFSRKDQPYCQLCSSFLSVSYSVHQSAVEHQSRIGILERSIALLNYYLLTIANPEEALLRDREFVDVPLQLCSTAEKEMIQRRPDYVHRIDWRRRLLQRWCRAIDSARGADFGRVRQLSASTSNQRLWRLRYLLRYLLQIKVIQASLDLQWGESAVSFSARAVVAEPTTGGFRRSTDFERLELVGDNIIKAMVPSRLQLLFPPVEGGASPRLCLMQQMLDSNAGLIAIYDFLRLNEIVGVELPNSKAKADVVEALIGELQAFVWAGETQQQGTPYACVGGRDTRYVVTLVRHTLEELVHLLLLWRLEGTLEAGHRFLEECTIQEFVRRRGKSTVGAAGGEDEQHRKAKAASQEGKLTRSPYDVLPLLSPEERYHPQVPPSTFGMENCFYSAHIAPVRASNVQEKQRELSEYPFATPSHYSDFYGMNGALSLTMDKSLYQKKYEEVLETLSAADMTDANSTADVGDALRPHICASPSWKREEKVRLCWQKLSRTLEPFRLTSSQVRAVMKNKLENSIHHAAREKHSVYMPDLSRERKAEPAHVNDRFKQRYVIENFSIRI